MSRSTLSGPLFVIVVMVGLIALILFSPLQMPVAAPAEQSSPTPTSSSPTPTTATATVTSTPTLTSVTGPSSANPTPTPTVTGTGATVNAETATLTPSPSNTLAPAATLTPAPPVDGAIACLPGDTIYIEGQGPALTALILYFDATPVGGGTSDASGHYRLKLVMANEKSGTYRVQVRVRGTRQVLQEIVCGVQSNTPTPTRARRTTPP